MLFLRLPFGIRGARLLALAACVFSPAAAHPDGAQAFKWSVQYLIDNSQVVAGRSQKIFPRQARGLASSPDGRYLYIGYNQSYTNSGEVRRVNLAIANYEHATAAVLPGHRGKAIAVDDEGRVYLADGGAVSIYDARLAHNLENIETNDCEGVAVTHEHGELVLYGTERQSGTLRRWVLHTSGGQITGVDPAGFPDGSGELSVPGAQSLRGLALDARGRIWMADLVAHKVFCMNADGSNLMSVQVFSPMAIAIDGEQAYVTCFRNRDIWILDMALNVTGKLNVPWEELQLAPFGNNHTGALDGIVAIPGGKGFFVVNGGGQTANQKSTYGKIDSNSEVIQGKLYTDAFVDDNEPILRAVPVTATDAPLPAAPEPALPQEPSAAEPGVVQPVDPAPSVPPAE